MKPKPRLLMVGGRWCCFSDGRAGTGPTVYYAYLQWLSGNSFYPF